MPQSRSLCMSTFLVVLTVFLTGAAFAEGRNEEREANRPGDSTGSDDELNLLVGAWVGPILEPFFEEYRTNTGVTVRYEAYPFRELLETIEIRQQAGSTDVDIFFVDAPLTASYAERGYMLPADAYFTASELEGTWAQTSAQAGRYGGAFYAAPLNNSSQVLYYNRALLKRAGVEFPPAAIEERWTWERLVEAARRVDALGDDIWGFAFDQINRYYQLQVLPASLAGGDGLSSDGLSAELTTPEWIRAFTWYRNLFNEWEISPKGVAPIEVPQMFAAGKIGFFVGGLWNIPAYFNEANIEYAVAPHPYFADGVPATPTLSWHVALWSGTDNADAAGAFMNWLTTNPAIGLHWLESHGQFPARLKVLQTIAENDKYRDQPFIAYRIASYEVQNTAIGRAKSVGFLAFEETVNGAIEDIRNGADPETTFTQAEMEIDRALRRYR